MRDPDGYLIEVCQLTGLLPAGPPWLSPVREPPEDGMALEAS